MLLVAVATGGERDDEIGEDGSLGGGEGTVPDKVDGYGIGEKAAIVVTDGERLLVLLRYKLTGG